MQPKFNKTPLEDLLKLKGKTALITGGARGIGAAIAQRLAEAGANLVIADIRLDQNNNLFKNLEKSFGIEALLIEVDVSKSEEVSNLIDSAHKHFGGIDILVNNAGIYPVAPLLEIQDEDYDQVIDLNQRATFITSRIVSKYLIEHKLRGVIINIAGSASQRTTGNSAHYVASKHAMIGLTKSFAKELGAQGIRVLAIAPTLTSTPGVEALKNNTQIKEGMLQFVNTLPIGRIAEPDDIAKVVLFAVSDMAEYMTGSTIFVDGGEFTL
jgi:NAD(P)-dependent dehydrogenase (short-subunit alcohol dehydrogenase family)